MQIHLHGLKALRLQLFNSMTPEFVSDRRKQLQTYLGRNVFCMYISNIILDEAMAVPEIATCRELHEFLGIGGKHFFSW